MRVRDLVPVPSPVPTLVYEPGQAHVRDHGQAHVHAMRRERVRGLFQEPGQVSEQGRDLVVARGLGQIQEHADAHGRRP